jgi:hypothetical protein
MPFVEKQTLILQLIKNGVDKEYIKLTVLKLITIKDVKILT